MNDQSFSDFAALKIATQPRDGFKPELVPGVSAKSKQPAFKFVAVGPKFGSKLRFRAGCVWARLDISMG